MKSHMAKALLVLLFSVSCLSGIAQAQEVIRGGLHGAVLGGLFGGEKGAKRGAALGAGVGAIKKLDQVQEEKRDREQYYESLEHQNANRTNFNDVAEQPHTTVIVNNVQPEQAPVTVPPAPSSLREVIIQKNGRCLVAVSYPVDWSQTVTPDSVTAISSDGLLWSAMTLIEDADQLESGVEKLRTGLKKELDAVAFRDVEMTDRGSPVLSGTAKSKKTGAEVEFVSGVFNADAEHIAALIFVADRNVAEMFKETAQIIVESVKTASDF